MSPPTAADEGGRPRKQVSWQGDIEDHLADKSAKDFAGLVDEIISNTKAEEAQRGLPCKTQDPKQMERDMMLAAMDVAAKDGIDMGKVLRTGSA
eukprot:9492922-Heterocapsa_arctica.AAC.1